MNEEIKNKAFKFLMLPTEEQQHYFARCFGHVRFLYNQMLAERISLYEQYKENKVELKEHKPRTYSQWKQEYDWLYEVDNLALANAQLQLQTAYRNFFRDTKIGFPKFRSKKSSKNTYTTNNQGENIRIENGKIHLPKIGWVRIKQHRAIPETHKIKSCTISLSPSGRYSIAILTEYEWEPPTVALSTDRALGLDYSSPHFYVDSQGVEANMPHFYRESELRLAREQRKLSRMKRGGKNYEKQRKRIARLCEHVANSRKDWTHKRSKELADAWDYVCVEDVNLQQMAMSLKLGKSTNDNGFGMFRTFLSYKLADRGKYLIKIDKWFPSSKLCRTCGAINSELTLSEREWDCECGEHHLRDLNAAINIRNAGIALLV